MLTPFDEFQIPSLAQGLKAGKQTVNNGSPRNSQRVGAAAMDIQAHSQTPTSVFQNSLRVGKSTGIGEYDG